MNEEKEFYGPLDVCTRTLEEIVPLFKAQFDGGKKRMRSEDIARMKKYLGRINRAHLEIKATLKEFELLNK